jgi:hypothetical protein
LAGEPDAGVWWGEYYESGGIRIALTTIEIKRFLRWPSRLRKILRQVSLN